MTKPTWREAAAARVCEAAQRVIDAWDADEIGQVDGGLIEDLGTALRELAAQPADTRARLPVTCGDCDECGFGKRGRYCRAAATPQRSGPHGPGVDADAPPPDFCPLRKERA